MTFKYLVNVTVWIHYKMVKKRSKRGWWISHGRLPFTCLMTDILLRLLIFNVTKCSNAINDIMFFPAEKNVRLLRKIFVIISDSLITSYFCVLMIRIGKTVYCTSLIGQVNILQLYYLWWDSDLFCFRVQKYLYVNKFCQVQKHL